MYRRFAQDKPLPFRVTHTDTPLTVPTYDSSGQTTHPDIVDMGNSSTFGGYRFWMANTPYPNSNTTLENPCIWASNDAETWVVPAGLTNPVVPAPATSGHYLSDTTLVYDRSLQKLRMYFRLTQDTNGDLIRMVESSDGITWSSPVTIIDYSGAIAAVSPQVAVNQVTGVYTLWIIRTNGCSSTYSAMERWTSSNGTTWTIVGNVTMNLPTGHQPWHFNLKPYNNYYLGVIYAYPINCSNSGKLYYIRSTDTDGDILEITDIPVLQKNTSSSHWASWTLYQSCILPVDGQWYIWYSARKREADNVTFANYMGLIKV